MVCAVVCGGGLSDDELAARLAAVGRDAVAAGDAAVGRGVGGPAVVRGLRRVLGLGLGPTLEGEIKFRFEISYCSLRIGNENAADKSNLQHLLGYIT